MVLHNTCIHYKLCLTFYFAGIGKFSAETRVQLLFSAKTEDELLFKKQFENISNSSLQTRYFVTSQNKTVTNQSSKIEHGRIERQTLQQSLDNLALNPVFVFVCGPNSMIKAVTSDLISLGIEERNIFYEMWW